MTRGAAGFTLLLLALGVALGGRSGDIGDAIVFAVLLLPFFLLHAGILVRLRGEKVGKGARSAVGTAALGLAAMMLMGLITWEEWSRTPWVLVSAFALAQVVMGTSALFLSRSLPSPPAPPPPVTADPRWTRRVKALALVSLAATLGPFAALGVALAFTEGPKTLLLIVFTAPLWGPYWLIWWRLRGRKQKDGLAMAIGIAPLAVALVLVIGLGVAMANGASWVGWLLGAFALTQAALVAASIRTYYTMQREPGDRGMLLKSVGAGGVGAIVVLFIAAATLPGTMRSREVANESTAVGSLRTIFTAAVTYRELYGNGFPPSLAVLGSPARGEEAGCRAADLVDPRLVSGEKNGYRFEYSAGTGRESGATDCPPGSDTFTVVARPQEYRRSGTRSFFVDESGEVRFTQEDRPATPDDPSFY